VRKRLSAGFVSHAHGDHFARHELTLCTPETARLLSVRFAYRGRFLFTPFGEPVSFGHAQVTSLPAGHVLGAAMALIEGGGERLLYTGDFRLTGGRTVGPAQPQRADTLVMESTFGDPSYVFPPREALEARLITAVEDALAAGRRPIVHAYELGKSQEVTAILVAAGFPVQQPPGAFAISQAYAELGVGFENPLLTKAVSPLQNRPAAGHVIVGPRGDKHIGGACAGWPVTRIAVSGWALKPNYARRMGVDVAIPLSDHADFAELMRLIELVEPRRVIAVHGGESFAKELRERGIQADFVNTRPSK